MLTFIRYSLITSPQCKVGDEGGVKKETWTERLRWLKARIYKKEVKALFSISSSSWHSYSTRKSPGYQLSPNFLPVTGQKREASEGPQRTVH
jgi:hypothetical protein